MPGCDVEPGKRICANCPEKDDCGEANLSPKKPMGAEHWLKSLREAVEAYSGDVRD